jgi:glycosyltransferase involved in cell wall biosynthesis
VLVDGASAFAEAFVDLVRDQPRLARLQQGALAHAASLTWENAAARHLDVLLRQARLRTRTRK